MKKVQRDTHIPHPTRYSHTSRQRLSFDPPGLFCPFSYWSFERCPAFSCGLSFTFCSSVLSQNDSCIQILVSMRSLPFHLSRKYSHIFQVVHNSKQPMQPILYFDTIHLFYLSIYHNFFHYQPAVFNFKKSVIYVANLWHSNYIPLTYSYILF